MKRLPLLLMTALLVSSPILLASPTSTTPTIRFGIYDGYLGDAVNFAITQVNPTVFPYLTKSYGSLPLKFDHPSERTTSLIYPKEIRHNIMTIVMDDSQKTTCQLNIDESQQLSITVVTDKKSSGAPLIPSSTVCGTLTKTIPPSGTTYWAWHFDKQLAVK